ncbi:MAG: hypothetical protein J7K53_00400 [Bacteroidales bacterium]|nr:hypothetical protein [Bacteroidales bacterium]
MKKLLSVMIVLTACISLLFAYATPIPFSYATGNSLTVQTVANTTDSNTAKVANDSEGLDLFYTVTIEKGKDTVHIDVNVQNLSQYSFEVGFYKASNDIHSYVKNLTVTENGSQIKVEYTRKNTWAISSPSKLSNVNIGYDISKIVSITMALPSMRQEGEVAVFINDLGGMLTSQYFFLVPINVATKNIKVQFNLPSEWQIVCPYVNRGTYFEVPKITNNLISNFVQRQGLTLGKMKFYSEEKVGDCTIKFGVSEADQSWDTKIHLSTQEDVDFYVQRVAAAVEKFTEIFGENPAPVITLYTYFRSGPSEEYKYGGESALGAYQYYAPDRYDELTGHLLYSWVSFTTGTMGEAPVYADGFIAKGLGESYLGCKMAYELTGDKAYLGEIYYYYLVYKRALDTKYMNLSEIKDSYYKGGSFGIYLDGLIQKETNGSKSIYDVFAYLYKKYKNSESYVGIPELEEAVNIVTGKDNSVIFNKYIYGNEEIPMQDIIQSYKESFGEFLKVLDSGSWKKQYRGYAIPFFVNVEMAIPLSDHLPFGLLIKDYYNDFAKYILANYDVNTLTKEDVETSLSKLTGEDCTGFFERWKDSYDELSLKEMKEWLKSYLPYKPENLEAIFKNNSVSLNWNQVEWRYPSGYYEVTGYEIYRGISLGEEEKIATVNSNSYIDTDIQIGKTYYYYIKSVENLFQEMTVYSDPSDEVAVICADTTPPKIEINSPDNNSVVDTDTVHVSGMAIDNESGIDKVTINDSEASLSSDGSFSKTVALTEGTNTITIIATDKAENESTKTIIVTYQKAVQKTVITLQPDNSYMTVNGVSQEIDPGRGTKPVIIPEWSRTVVPIRAIVEALGGTIEWDGTERKVTINFDSTTIELWIDNPQAKVNGTMVYIDSDNHSVKPIIINDRTMLPLRFVAESLGCDVGWDNDTRTITITYDG